jgi:hypothetical protein
VLERYQSLAADGPRRDSGGLLRAALIRGLLRRALASEVPLLESALQTYEFIRSDEVACGLRAAALVAMADLDERLAAFHAVRLLGDPHTSQMSGEPAVTAARVLGSQGHTLPLYQRLLAPGVQPEVAAACFEGLGDAPASILGSLAEGPWQEAAGFVLLALIDVMLAHPDADHLANALAGIIESSDDLDVVRYAATAIVAGRRPGLIGELRLQANLPGPRGELIREALFLLPD